MRRSLAVLATAVVAAVALAGCEFDGIYSLPLPGNVSTGPNAYGVVVEFDDVTALVPESAVKVGSVTVGTVRDIELAGRGEEAWYARVTCVLKGDVRLPDNAVAKVAQTSLLGEKYVQISRPAAAPPRGRLSTGDVIPLARTGRYPEVETVLTALSLLLNGGGLAQLNTITAELNAALNGREAAVRDLVQQLDTFVSGLEEQKTQIVRAIEGLERLTNRLAEQKEVLADAVDRIGPALEILDAQQEDLTRMLVALSDLGDVATRVIDQSREDLLANLRNLRPILSRLAEAGDDLPKALELLATFPFPRTVPQGIRGDYVNLDITASLGLQTLLGNLTGSGLGLGGTPLGDPMGRPSTPGEIRERSTGPPMPAPSAPSAPSSPSPSSSPGDGRPDQTQAPDSGSGSGGSRGGGLLGLLTGSER